MQLVVVEFIKLMWKEDEFITQIKFKNLAISKIEEKKTTETKVKYFAI